MTLKQFGGSKHFMGRYSTTGGNRLPPVNVQEEGKIEVLAGYSDLRCGNVNAKIQGPDGE